MAILAVLLLLAAAAPEAVQAQERHYRAVRIDDIYGDGLLAVDEAGYFRARIRFGAAVPIEYTWDFGDRTVGEGNGIAHRYERPGRYVVRVTARNPHGSDTDSLVVTVFGTAETPVQPAVVDTPAPAPVPDAAPATPPADTPTATPADEPAATPAPRPVEPPIRASGPRPTAYHLYSSLPPRSGYTWVVRTHLHREAAEAEMLQFRKDGYRTGIFVDTKSAGSTAYRVIIGQFTSPGMALYVRNRLPAETIDGAWLLQLPKE